MDRATYQRFLQTLASPADVDRAAEQEGIDRELLFVIYTHRITRDATRRFYVVRHQVPRLASRWKRGTRMLELAREQNFPPVLLGQQLLQELGLPRKRIWGCFLDPSTAPDARLKEEVQELLSNDLIYSPEGMELQRDRGRRGEARLYAWLEKHGVRYRTEKDLRGKHTKTPDALLDAPISVSGQNIRWIESKANFGDDVELRRNLRKQLAPYTTHFGEGAVVYWYGYVDGATSPPGILLWNGTELEGLTPQVPGLSLEGSAESPSRDLARPHSPAPTPSGPRGSPAGHDGGMHH